MKAVAVCLAVAGTIWAQVNGNVVNPRALFVQTATVTIANTVTETSIIGTGVGSMTLAANFLQPGTMLRFTAIGIHTASGNPNVTINVKIGGTTVATGTVASQTSTNEIAEISVYLTCRTAGAGGTVFLQGTYREWAAGANNSVGLPTTATTSVDTTAKPLMFRSPGEPLR